MAVMALKRFLFAKETVAIMCGDDKYAAEHSQNKPNQLAKCSVKN